MKGLIMGLFSNRIQPGPMDTEEGREYAAEVADNQANMLRANGDNGTADAYEAWAAEQRR